MGTHTRLGAATYIMYMSLCDFGQERRLKVRGCRYPHPRRNQAPRATAAPSRGSCGAGRRRRGWRLRRTAAAIRARPLPAPAAPGPPGSRAPAAWVGQEPSARGSCWRGVDNVGLVWKITVLFQNVKNGIIYFLFLFFFLCFQKFNSSYFTPVEITGRSFVLKPLQF